MKCVRNFVGAMTAAMSLTPAAAEVYRSNVPIEHAISMTSAVDKTITSIDVPAGEFTCSGDVAFKPSPSAETYNIGGGISETNNLLPLRGTGGRVTIAGPFTKPLSPNSGMSIPVGSFSFSVPSNSTVTKYLVSKVYFDTSTMRSYGSIECRRECVLCQ